MPRFSPVRQALCEALDDEYKARALYAAAINTFGPIPPFITIIQSEHRHVGALADLFAARGWTAPDDPYLGRMTVSGTMEETCAAAVQAEIDNVALYDRLNAMVAGEPDVLRVFANLQRASRENHLPAFQRAATGMAEDNGAGHRCCGGAGGRGRHGCGHGPAFPA